MYAFVVQPVTSLDHGGRFLIWSMRSWVKAMGEKRCPQIVLCNAFAKWKMVSGLQPFLRIMMVFNRRGRETFGFCQLQCNHISEHEAIILSLVCALRESRPEAVRTFAGHLVDGEAVDELIANLSALGRAMRQAGIFPAHTTSAAGMR